LYDVYGVTFSGHSVCVKVHKFTSAVLKCR